MECLLDAEANFPEKSSSGQKQIFAFDRIFEKKENRFLKHKIENFLISGHRKDFEQSTRRNLLGCKGKNKQIFKKCFIQNYEKIK